MELVVRMYQQEGDGGRKGVGGGGGEEGGSPRLLEMTRWAMELRGLLYWRTEPKI